MNAGQDHTTSTVAEQLATLIDLHGPGLVLYARQICDEPEDVVQEAFLELIRQKEPPAQTAAWLHRVVRNRALDRTRSARRRKHRQETATSRNVWLTANPDSQLDAAIVTESLQELDPELREIITARIWSELSFEAIAELMNTSSSTAHRRYIEGLEQLRERLGAACPKNA